MDQEQKRERELSKQSIIHNTCGKQCQTDMNKIQYSDDHIARTRGTMQNHFFKAVT